FDLVTANASKPNRHGTFATPVRLPHHRFRNLQERLDLHPKAGTKSPTPVLVGFDFHRHSPFAVCTNLDNSRAKSGASPCNYFTARKCGEDLLSKTKELFWGA